VVKTSGFEWKGFGFESCCTHSSFFFNKALYYVMLHFYLQQPGIIKLFLLCNIPGKVPLFFLYKQDIIRLNCIQNITKYYILLRNVASVLKLISSFIYAYFGFLPFAMNLCKQVLDVDNLTEVLCKKRKELWVENVYFNTHTNNNNEIKKKRKKIILSTWSTNGFFSLDHKMKQLSL
jgi:hypothetical protein